MKSVKIILPLLLLAMLLFPTVAYADDPPDDPGLDVDIVVVGGNADVEVDVAGEDSEVTVNTAGTEVWINGQNLNQPTVIHQGGGGVGGSWVKKRIGQAVGPLYSWMDEYTAKVELAANGLAKVIFLAQGNEATLEAQISLSDEHGSRLTSLESETAYLEEQVDALQDQDAQITARVNYLRAYYNRILVTIVILFSVVIIGLAVGLGMLWRRLRIT